MSAAGQKSSFAAEAADHGAGRRRILKLLAAGGAGAAAAALVPGRWTKPLATIGALPAHAQVSGTSGDLQAEMAWSSLGTQVDYELHIVDPADDADVFGGNVSSATLDHKGDATLANNGSEIAGNLPAGIVAAGTYQVYLRSASLNCGTQQGETISVQLTVNGSTTNIDMTAPFVSSPGSGVSRRVANVTFPGGIVATAGVTGQPYP